MRSLAHRLSVAVGAAIDLTAGRCFTSLAEQCKTSLFYRLYLDMQIPARAGQHSTSLVQDSSGAHSSSIQGAPVPPCLSFSSSTCIRPDRVGRRSTSLTQQLVMLQDPSRRSTCRFWPSIVTRQLQKATVEGTIVAVCNPEVPGAPFFRNKPTCYSTRVWLYSLTYSLAHAS